LQITLLARANVLFKNNPLKRQAILAASFSVIATIYSAPSFAVVDPVILTFSTVGDSRQDSVSIDPSLVKTVQDPALKYQTPFVF
jgi:hypothetical protein